MSAALPLNEPLFWLLASVGVVLSGISKSGLAGGAGVIAVPLLSLVLPLPLATALLLPLLIAMDAQTLRYYWRQISWAEARWLLPAAALGVALGTALLGSLSATHLQLMLGVLCVLFALWQNLLPYLTRWRRAALLWGTLSGVSSTLLHAGGPPLNAYLLGRNLAKAHWLATAAVVFALMNWLKVPAYLTLGSWSAGVLLCALALLPLAWLGVWLGKRLQGRINQQQFIRLCRGLLLLSGLLLLGKGWLAA